MTAELRAQAAEWLARRERGSPSTEEARAFADWLATSDAHRRAWAEAESLWRELRALDTVARPQLDQARQRYRRRPPPGARQRRALLALAAGLGLLAIAYPLLDPGARATLVPVATAVGERRTVALADGSTVELDSATHIEVRYSRWSRQVRLIDGQALFTVAHERWRGFEVVAGRDRVIDIGTRFEVRRRDDATAVAVLDGRVDVQAGAGGPTARLAGGLAVEITADGAMSAVRPIAVERAAAWRRGELIVRDQPLAAVLAELGRYQTAEIVAAAPALLEVHVSGVFPTDDLPLALATLAAVLPARLVAVGERRWRFEPR